MLTPLKEIRPGEPIKATFLNEIVRQLRAIAPQSSSDILVDTQSGGTTYRLKRLNRSKASGDTYELRQRCHNLFATQAVKRLDN